jgi:hypothetical protein
MITMFFGDVEKRRVYLLNFGKERIYEPGAVIYLYTQQACKMAIYGSDGIYVLA